MVNVGLGPSIFLGFFTISAVFWLYTIRTVKYDVSRDSDIFYTTLAILYTAIIVFHGWRLDPILLLAQMIFVLLMLCLGYENIRLRGVVKAQKDTKNKVARENKRYLATAVENLEQIKEQLEITKKVAEEQRESAAGLTGQLVFFKSNTRQRLAMKDILIRDECERSRILEEQLAILQDEDDYEGDL
jgi:hypothetical protein